MEIIFLLIMIRGGAGKSLARPTSRCRRMESIVLLERGVIYDLLAYATGPILIILVFTRKIVLHPI